MLSLYSYSPKYFDNCHSIVNGRCKKHEDKVGRRLIQTVRVENDRFHLDFSAVFNASYIRCIIKRTTYRSAMWKFHLKDAHRWSLNDHSSHWSHRMRKSRWSAFTGLLGSWLRVLCIKQITSQCCVHRRRWWQSPSTNTWDAFRSSLARTCSSSSRRIGSHDTKRIMLLRSYSSWYHSSVIHNSSLSQVATCRQTSKKATFG